MKNILPDEKCIRDLLILLGEQLSPSASGKAPKPLKIQKLMDDALLRKYAPEEIYSAAQTLAHKKLVTLAHSDAAPKRYVFRSVTPRGYDYFRLLRDDTLWNKLTRSAGRVFESSFPDLLQLAAQFGFPFIS